jgi:hypothetical protein
VDHGLCLARAWRTTRRVSSRGCSCPGRSLGRGTGPFNRLGPTQTSVQGRGLLWSAFCMVLMTINSATGYQVAGSPPPRHPPPRPRRTHWAGAGPRSTIQGVDRVSSPGYRADFHQGPPVGGPQGFARRSSSPLRGRAPTCKRRCFPVHGGGRRSGCECHLLGGQWTRRVTVPELGLPRMVSTVRPLPRYVPLVADFFELATGLDEGHCMSR